MRILLVEDEIKMAQAVSEILRQDGYEVDACTDGDSGADASLSGLYDLLILDIMLPRRSGLDILRDVRNSGSKVPILMLTAKSELSDKVSGLDSGADDYLTKPFEVEELLARIRALSRRGTGAKPDGMLRAGNLALCPTTAILRNEVSGEEVRLSEKEHKIMECLISSYPGIVPREQLAVKVWGYESEAEYNNVEVYLTFTRKKLTFIRADLEIKAVRGMGYELRERK